MSESLRPYIRAAQNGDTAALHEVAKKFEPLVTSTARRHRVQFPSEPEATSLAWYAILQCIQDYDLTQPMPVPYCMKKFVNTLFKHDLRRKKREAKHLTKTIIIDGEMTDIPSNVEDRHCEGPGEQYIRKEEYKRLYAAVARLPLWHQRMLRLHYRRGYTHAEIGRMYKISASYVSKLMKKDYELLREMLNGNMEMEA